MKSNKSLWRKQSTKGRNETQNVLFTGGRRHFIELYFYYLSVFRITQGAIKDNTQFSQKKNIIISSNKGMGKKVKEGKGKKK